ncbi:hypothetical protein B0H16DRAFT_1469071 [Mycena metata]|uniref:Uncharacterized protein n=1 Tax=Mycena metata TaxID=1033252 RepID=A0AAD7MSP9_9AGAR|nr:hypothetical protein B0H16DRAFT_1469071 [Mycena metata]
MLGAATLGHSTVSHAVDPNRLLHVPRTSPRDGRPKSTATKGFRGLNPAIDKAHLAGTRILDLALAVLCPERRGGGVPGQEIFKIARISPAACAHLVPAVLAMCMGETGGLSKAALMLLDLLVGFRAAMDTEVYKWLLGKFSGDAESKGRLEDLVRATRAGARFGIEAKCYSAVELTQLYRGAMERLEERWER